MPFFTCRISPVSEVEVEARPVARRPPSTQRMQFFDKKKDLRNNTMQKKEEDKEVEK